MGKFGVLFRLRRANTPLARMERALRRLDPVSREVFLMHRLESLGYPEIAERLGLSVEEVETCIARAMLRLAKALESG